MSRTNAAILTRWRAKLVIRRALLSAARSRFASAQRALSRARAKNVHPRQRLVDALDAADKTLVKRRAQVREAERVIARHRDRSHVAKPVVPILQHSWGYHPGVHDGVDLITEGDDVLYALCDAVVIDARSSGWWGLGARASGGHSVADGDGIIQLRCTTDVGPFRKGMHFGYGHAEKATVRVGQKVKAGQKIGHAGFANAWHVHFMANDGHTTKGIGTMDPWPFVAYAIKHDD